MLILAQQRDPCAAEAHGVLGVAELRVAGGVLAEVRHVELDPAAGGDQRLGRRAGTWPPRPLWRSRPTASPGRRPLGQVRVGVVAAAAARHIVGRQSSAVVGRPAAICGGFPPGGRLVGAVARWHVSLVILRLQACRRNDNRQKQQANTATEYMRMHHLVSP